MRILLIEDNEQLSALTEEGLNRCGIAVDVAPNLGIAREFLALGSFDAIILDLGLPDGDGIDWLKASSDDRPPVLVLTARHTLDERVLGLDSGADDYLVKPAEVDEIAARLRALTRRPKWRQVSLLSRGRIELDTDTREVRVSDHAVPLGRKETDLLEALMRRKGVVSREAIEAAVYGLSDAVTPNALEALASRLRRRLADAGENDVLHTVRGVGYYLAGSSGT